MEKNLSVLDPFPVVSRNAGRGGENDSGHGYFRRSGARGVLVSASESGQVREGSSKTWV